MVRINSAQFKANDIGGNEATRSQLLADLQAAIAEIEDYLDHYEEILSEEQLFEAQRISMMLKAESSAIAAYGMGGSGGGAGSVDGDASSWVDLPQNLNDGWEDNGVPADNINQYADEPQLDNWDDDRYGEYAGTVEISNSGNPNDPTSIGFQMYDSEEHGEMQSLTGESRGRDIIITVTFEDGHRESWVVREATVRPEPIIISALGLNHKVSIDMSHCLRVSDGSYTGYDYGTRSGFYIYGTEYDDILRGSMADDGIVGLAGNDEIYGMAGNDTLYGDEAYAYAGQQNEEYGGRDRVIGGAGSDTIFGGGKIDEYSAADLNDASGVINECETKINDETSTQDLEEIRNILNGGSSETDTMGNGWRASVEGGEVVIKNIGDGSGGEIEINMNYLPDGYNMCYGERNADGSLSLTFVGFDEEGNSISFTMRIENFFGSFGDNDDPDSALVHLHIVGTDEDDIIDMSQVQVDASQTISFDLGEGVDIGLGARNKLMAEGIDIDDLVNGRSQGNSSGTANHYISDGVFAYDDEETMNGVMGYEDENGDDHAGSLTTTANADGSITIDGNGTADNPLPETLNIRVPEEYTHGYMANGGDGYYYLILVAPGNPAKTMVIKIDKGLYDDAGWSLGDVMLFREMAAEEGDGFDFIQEKVDIEYISIDFDDYELSGGENDGEYDLIFTQSSKRVAEEAEDDVIEGDYNGNGGSQTGRTERVETPESENEEEVEDEDSEDGEGE